MIRFTLSFALWILFSIASASAQSQDLTFAELQKQYQSEERPLEHFAALSEKHASNAWVFHFRGLSEEESGLDQAAQRSFERAQSLDPNQAWHAQTLGNHWVGRANFAQALRFYDQAVQLEQRPGPAQSLRDQATQARRRATTKEEYTDSDSTSRLRIVFLGILGFVVIGLLHLFGPRLIR